MPIPSQAAGFTDIDRTHWTLRALPPALRPYGRLARWDRPIGIWLLLFPGWWAVAMAAPLADGSALLHFGWLMVAFAIGAIAMRGAGCTWNDILDRDIDAQVERTRTRPLPAGEVGLRQAMTWMALQAAVGAAVLLTFNVFAVAVGLASLLVVAIYPLMKRVTYWPQFFLGLAFNYGALLGWAAVESSLDWPALALYVAGISWTLGYDTIYAHQDKEDDALIGVKSTALRFGKATKPWLAGFYGATIVLLALTAALRGLHPLFYAALAAGALQLAWQVRDADLDDPADCLRKFKSNRLYGWIILAGIFCAWAPDNVRALVLLGAPLCFEATTSRFRDALVSLVPSEISESELFPGSLLSQMSALASPETFVWSRLTDAVLSIADPRALDIHARVERWALDEVALPGRLVHQIIDWLYRENRFCRGTLPVRQRLVGPRGLTTATLAVVNTADAVAPPAAVEPFIEKTAAADVRVIHHPGEIGVGLQHLGILVGREAHAKVWPEIFSWLEARS